jgi:hypothetical protein
MNLQQNLLFYFLVGYNINTLRKNTVALTDARKEVGIEVNTEKIKYMLMSRHHNTGKNHNIEIGNRSFEDVEKFKYLRTTVTNQILIHEEIKSRHNSDNACYHSVQNLLHGKAYSTHGEDECIKRFGGKSRTTDHYEDLDAGGRITLKRILDK